MRTVTIDQVMELRPCYTRKEVEKFAGGLVQASAADLLKLVDVPWRDLLWVLHCARLIEDRIWRLWAIDCATRALPHFERKYPADKRPREALIAASSYLLGEISLDELRAKSAADAAAYAAYAAARAAYAAHAAAYAAADAADAADAAAYAAYAAGAAAVYAADAAADAAAVYAAVYAAANAADARKTEHNWQRGRLLELVLQFQVEGR